MTGVENGFILLVYAAGWLALLGIGGIVYHVGEWIYHKWRRSRSRVITW